MKTKLLIASMAVAGMAIAPFAHATVVDGWQLNQPSGLTTDIGHLDLGSGITTVDQQVTSSGQVFVGAAFADFGAIYSLTYTQENAVGSGDTGPLGLISGHELEIKLTGLAGDITAYNSTTGAATYAYTSGVGTMQLIDATTNTVLANMTVGQPSTGTVGDFSTLVGTTGVTTLTGVVSSTGLSPNLFQTSTGASLTPQAVLGDLLASITTTNNISAASPGVLSTYNFGGSVGTTTDAVFTVTSEGSLNLVTVPEPSMLLLLGGGLLAASTIRRSRSA